MSDLIDRQDAIRWVKTECNPYGNPTLDFESGKKVIEHLKQMTSAERKKGEWIYVKKPLARGGYIDASECSVCHKIIFPYVNMNYCPNCGAKMNEEKPDVTLNRC